MRGTTYAWLVSGACVMGACGCAADRPQQTAAAPTKAAGIDKPAQKGPNVRPVVSDNRKVYRVAPIQAEGLEVRLTGVSLNKNVTVGRGNTYSDDWRLSFRFSVNDPAGGMTFRVDPIATVSLLTDEQNQPLDLRPEEMDSGRPDSQWRMGSRVMRREGSYYATDVTDEVRLTTIPGFFGRAEGHLRAQIVEGLKQVELPMAVSDGWAQVSDGVRARVTHVDVKQEERRRFVRFEVETPADSDADESITPFVLSVDIQAPLRTSRPEVELEDEVILEGRKLKRYISQYYVNDDEGDRRVRISVATVVRRVEIPFCFTGIPGSGE